jgi:hypothetical protein
MGIHTAFAALTEVIEVYESRGRSIETVEASPVDTDGAVLDVTMAMPVSLGSGGADEGLTPEAARLTGGGDLEVRFTPSATDLPSTPGAELSVDDASATVTDDGLLLTVQLRIDATEPPDGTATEDCEPEGAGTDEPAATEAPIPPDTGGDSEESNDTRTEPDGFAAVRDDSVPPYEDTDYLQALYDECDNFREIAEQIQMDVSSETVRRYMIEADIHVPNSYDTSSDDGEAAAESDDVDQGATDEDSRASAADPIAPDTTGPDEPVGELPDEQLVTDGLGLPADVQLREVADAVADADTVYEVQRRLDLDRGKTRDLLEDLNLLDLVLCRLTDEPDHAVSYETVAGRIRQCTPHSA